ncbi:MAG: 2-oxoglutarate dehydrogenase E1 component [Alphaproteobacteria bacterium]|nr:2-oxoglutarate dehydrogenase E1 component [Alphaproteobacteria bacterium]
MSRALDATQFLAGGNSAFIQQLYAKYKLDPDSVDPSWRPFFADLADEPGLVQAAGKAAPWGRPLPAPADDDPRPQPAKAKAGAPAVDPMAARQQAHDSIRALQLIRAFRARGHMIAKLDPLGLERREAHPELDPATFGFGEKDLDRPIFLAGVLGLESATLRHILEVLHSNYCGHIGVEYTHINYPAERAWIQQHFEGEKKDAHFTPEGKRAILKKLIEAEGFERFLQVKFTGTKRFGLEGGESLIPALEAIIKRGGQLGLRDIIIGMPHRGRLSVLANVMSKPYQAIFSEFQGGSANPDEVEGSGDVKYHLGTSSDREFDGNRVHLSLTANPSHLETVDPVVLGKARSKQAQLGDVERVQVLPLLLHGDAAFAGQGLLQECFGLSELKGYRTGGTIHVIVNNQIGFTTSPKYSRSSPYPTDVAKAVQAPVFHVNGDDPEAVVHVAKIATEYRQTFKRDVVIDMFCYRRHGHNETDEPMFTQPIMYRAIGQHPTTYQIYRKRLADEGVVSEAEADAFFKEFNDRLESDFKAAASFKPNKADWLEGRWAGMEKAAGEDRRGVTGVKIERLKEVGQALARPPENFDLHRTVRRLLEAKKKMIESGEGVDWATAEALAFGTLLSEGVPVRLSGQDSGRGTFSHRHSVFVDQTTEARYEPLNHLKDGQARYEVIDSMLSEYAVLGFEYGYTLAEPNALVLWEAQFGDFANGAQVMIDTFLASGESKWLRMSGLTMLLPHGFEGQGPEHSSARLERYLQLCAEDNMQVCNITTPSNYFHALRRQIHRPFRKPLVIMAPKSLLRHKRCVSRLDEMTEGATFHRVLWDNRPIDAAGEKKVKRVVMCSGKVYFDLFEAREQGKIKDVYLLRIEQYHPFPYKPLMAELKRFLGAEMVWCQEEPQNQGAWTFVDPCIEAVLTRIGAGFKRARYVGRPASASPATGSHKKHHDEQEKLVHDALAL